MQASRNHHLEPGTIWKGRFDQMVSLQCQSGALWLTRGPRDIILQRGGTISLALHDQVMLQALGDEPARFTLTALAPPRRHLWRELLQIWHRTPRSKRNPLLFRSGYFFHGTNIPPSGIFNIRNE